MGKPTAISSRIARGALLSGLLFLFTLGAHTRVAAQAPLNLANVKPVIACEQIAAANLGSIDGKRVTVDSAALMDTSKGQFCKVDGSVEGLTVFEVFLPVEHWTQRLLENSSNASAIANGNGCAPALNGELAVAFNNMGMGGAPGNQPGPRGNQPAGPAAPPAASLQDRVASAQNSPIHATAQAAKTLIKTYYGQPPRFSYFMGCSMGGGQALSEVQRFPDDFDGVSAGSPLMIPSVHNIFFHPWESYINKRADGSRILRSNRLPILHKAVMEHCAAGAGELDGVLLQPTACKFDPAWVQCKPAAAAAQQCLTAEEVRVVQKLYEGPGDGNGHHFEIAGFAIGSELRWGLSTADHVANPEAAIGPRLKGALIPPDSDRSADQLQKDFDYSQQWFDKILVMAPLVDSTNTNIRPFQKHGGKLILWNGAEDLTIQPEISVAYYQGVQKALGVEATDSFMRLFMIPGFGHCGGGEIPFQFDVLTPLMAWTETGRAPERILSSNPAAAQAPPQAYGGARTPVAAPFMPELFSRPVFPFPYMARYSGKGDPNDPASYTPVKSAAPVPQTFHSEVMQLIAPDNQKTYHVEDGKPVPDNK